MKRKWTGHEVAVLRDKLRLTQEELAHEIGMTVGAVNRWENGKMVPSKLAQRELDLLEAKRTIKQNKTEA